MEGIKINRERVGLTQAQLAEKMHTTQSTVAMWESGSSFPRASVLPKLAKALGCSSIDDLYADDKCSA